MAYRWLVIKGCVPVVVCNSINKAEAIYAKYECDEIRRVQDDSPPLTVTLRSKEPNTIWKDNK